MVNLCFADVMCRLERRIRAPSSFERFPSHTKTQEFLHALGAKVFAEARGSRAGERACAWLDGVVRDAAPLPPGRAAHGRPPHAALLQAATPPRSRARAWLRRSARDLVGPCLAAPPPPDRVT